MDTKVVWIKGRCGGSGARGRVRTKVINGLVGVTWDIVSGERCDGEGDTITCSRHDKASSGEDDDQGIGSLSCIGELNRVSNRYEQLNSMTLRSSTLIAACAASVPRRLKTSMQLFEYVCVNWHRARGKEEALRVGNFRGIRIHECRINLQRCRGLDKLRDLCLPFGMGRES